MQETTCKICGHQTNHIMDGKILDKYNVKYFHCPNCDFVQTEEPYWLAEAYIDPINKYDTGIMVRNLVCVEIAKKLLKKYKSKNILDYAGGYGIFTRMMRDLGFNVYWSDKYCENIIATNCEWNNENIDALTIFECFEHFVDPIKEIDHLFSISDTILCSTLLFKPGQPKPVDKWWYYAPQTGQHISFYSEKTIKFVAKKYNCKYNIIKATKYLNFILLRRKN